MLSETLASSAAFVFYGGGGEFYHVFEWASIIGRDLISVVLLLIVPLFGNDWFRTYQIALNIDMVRYSRRTHVCFFHDNPVAPLHVETD